MPQCIAPGCKSDSSKANQRKYLWMKDVTFHSFPSEKDDAQLYNEWLQIIRKVRREKGYTPNKFDHLCSLHFVGKNGPTVQNPVPTQFSYSILKLEDATTAVNKAISSQKNATTLLSVDRELKEPAHECHHNDKANAIVTPATMTNTAASKQNMDSNVNQSEKCISIVNSEYRKVYDDEESLMRTQYSLPLTHDDHKGLPKISSETKSVIPMKNYRYKQKFRRTIRLKLHSQKPKPNNTTLNSDCHDKKFKNLNVIPKTKLDSCRKSHYALTNIGMLPQNDRSLIPNVNSTLNSTVKSFTTFDKTKNMSKGSVNISKPTSFLQTTPNMKTGQETIGGGKIREHNQVLPVTLGIQARKLSTTPRKFMKTGQVKSINVTPSASKCDESNNPVCNNSAIPSPLTVLPSLTVPPPITVPQSLTAPTHPSYVTLTMPLQVFVRAGTSVSVQTEPVHKNADVGKLHSVAVQTEPYQCPECEYRVKPPVFEMIPIKREKVIEEESEFNMENVCVKSEDLSDEYGYSQDSFMIQGNSDVT